MKFNISVLQHNLESMEEIGIQDHALDHYIIYALPGSSDLAQNPLEEMQNPYRLLSICGSRLLKM